MRTRSRVIAVAVAVMVAAGCSQTPDVTRDPTGSSAPSATGTVGAPASAEPAGGGTPVDLSARKKAAGIADCPDSAATLAPVDKGLPDVVLPCLGGGTPVRLAGLRGRPMLINVWAQWCEPCRKEAPFLSEVASTDHSGLLIMGVDFNDPRPELAIDFAEAASWKYPQVVDENKAISAPLQLSAIPQTLLVDANGRIVYRHAGPFQSADEIRELLHEHLGVAL
jgi:thiol-disulfide isomerase/thioredoxin